MAVRQLEVLEFGELLGSLLGAIVTAQQQSARATVDFIEAVGLTAAGPDGVSAMRTVALRFRKRDANGDVADFEVEVPLLTLVNPPALSVAEATLDFGYELLGTERTAAPPPAVSNAPPPAAPDVAPSGAVILPIDRPVKLRGVVRTTPTPEGPADQRTSFTVNVHVVVRQEPTSVGVQRLFNLAELGINERPAPAPAPDGPAPPA
jgi:hypothetical protein